MKLIKTENFFLREEDVERDAAVTYTRLMRKDKYDTVEIVNHDFSYFACTCSPSDKQYWNTKLQEYMPDFNPEVHASLVSQLCAEITHGFDGYVGAIDMDMWFGMSISGTIWLDDKCTEYETYNISMQCDDVTLGLIAAVTILRTIFADE